MWFRLCNNSLQTDYIKSIICYWDLLPSWVESKTSIENRFKRISFVLGSQVVEVIMR